MSHELVLLVVFAGSLLAGALNALAGGGSFVTFPALLFAGLDPRAANITSTVALFPGQALSGWAGRGLMQGPGGLSTGTVGAISLLGGAAGAVLLLVTPAEFFARLVPWLVLFATAVFAWGSFFRKPPDGRRRLRSVAVVQFAIAVYGGYFGGGIGFLMLAVLTTAGLPIRAAGATKNMLAALINFSAVAVFVFSPDVDWRLAVVVAAGSIGGSVAGAFLLRRVPERLLRGGVVTAGAALTVGLFLRQG